MLGIWFAAQIATAQNNNLVIFSKDKHKFFLLVNGAQQNENPYANLKLEKINYQNVNVKVIFESGEIANIERVISFDLADKDHEYVYSILPEKNKKGDMQLSLIANRPIHKSKKESGQIISTFRPGDEPVNPASNPSVVNNNDNPPPLPNSNGNNGNSGNNGNNGNGGNNGSNWGGSDPNNWGGSGNSTITSNSSTTVSSSTNGQAPTTNTWGHNNSTVTNNGSTTVNNSTFGTPPPNYDPNASSADIQKMRADAQKQMDDARKEMERARQQAQTEMERARAQMGNRPSGFGDKNNTDNPPAPVSTSPGMSDASFQQLVADINSKSFSRDKASTMEKGITNQTLNMSQLKTLVGMLDFDNDKVRIATLGYQKCTDKDNYKMLQDSFSFSKSMGDFTRAIGR